MVERSAAAREAVERRERCEVGAILRAAGLDYGCLIVPQTWQVGWGHHHRRKASSGGSDAIGPNSLWCCPVCNGAVEDHDTEVRQATGDALIVREGDDEYAALGRRAS